MARLFDCFLREKRILDNIEKHYSQGQDLILLHTIDDIREIREAVNGALNDAIDGQLTQLTYNKCREHTLFKYLSACKQDPNRKCSASFAEEIMNSSDDISLLLISLDPLLPRSVEFFISVPAQSAKSQFDLRNLYLAWLARRLGAEHPTLSLKIAHKNRFKALWLANKQYWSHLPVLTCAD